MNIENTISVQKGSHFDTAYQMFNTLKKDFF